MRAPALLLCTVLGVFLTASPGACQGSPSTSLPAGPAPELDPIARLVGAWELHVEQFRPGSEDWIVVPSDTSLVWLEMDGRYVRQRLVLRPPGQRPLTTDFLFSFDPWERRYRVAVLDDLFGLLDVFEGTWEGGTLRVDNVESRTFFSDQGIASRFDLDLEEDRIHVRQWISYDEGATWTELYRGSATRIPR